MAQIYLNQVAPLEANAGLQQEINVTQSGLGNGVGGLANDSALPGTGTAQAPTYSLGMLLFFAAVIYYFFFRRAN